jgi:hypothetical protein
MTYEEMEKVVASVGFKNPPFPIKLGMTLHAWGGATVRVRLWVTLRESVTGDGLCWFEHYFPVPRYFGDSDFLGRPVQENMFSSGHFLRFVLDCVDRAYLHELDECVYVDGVRVNDFQATHPFPNRRR